MMNFENAATQKIPAVHIKWNDLFSKYILSHFGCSLIFSCQPISKSMVLPEFITIEIFHSPSISSNPNLLESISAVLRSRTVMRRLSAYG